MTVLRVLVHGPHVQTVTESTSPAGVGVHGAFPGDLSNQHAREDKGGGRISESGCHLPSTRGFRKAAVRHRERRSPLHRGGQTCRVCQQHFSLEKNRLVEVKYSIN